jgi:hypothetical protein
MALIRGHHDFDEQFTQIPNAWLRDKRLSLATRGLLAQIMSHKPGWTITLENLAAANGVGRDAIRVCLNQLIATGYLSRSEERERNSAGHLTSYTYTTQTPQGEQPTSENPTLVAPTLVEPQHKNKKVKEEQVEERKSAPTRIPADFALTDEMRDWAKSNAPEVDVDLQTANFIDYWQSKAKDNTKLDWLATWRAWMRNDQDRKSRYKPRNRVADRERENAERRARLLAEEAAND